MLHKVEEGNATNTAAVFARLLLPSSIVWWLLGGLESVIEAYAPSLLE